MPNFYYYKGKTSSGYILWNRLGNKVETWQVTLEGLKWLSDKLRQPDQNDFLDEKPEGLRNRRSIPREICAEAMSAGHIYLKNVKPWSVVDNTQDEDLGLDPDELRDKLVSPPPVTENDVEEPSQPEAVIADLPEPSLPVEPEKGWWPKFLEWIRKWLT